MRLCHLRESKNQLSWYYSFLKFRKMRSNKWINCVHLCFCPKCKVHIGIPLVFFRSFTDEVSQDSCRWGSWPKIPARPQSILTVRPHQILETWTPELRTSRGGWDDRVEERTAEKWTGPRGATREEPKHHTHIPPDCLQMTLHGYHFPASNNTLHFHTAFNFPRCSVHIIMPSPNYLRSRNQLGCDSVTQVNPPSVWNAVPNNSSPFYFAFNFLKSHPVYYCIFPASPGK